MGALEDASILGNGAMQQPLAGVTQLSEQVDKHVGVGAGARFVAGVYLDKIRDDRQSLADVFALGRQLSQDLPVLFVFRKPSTAHEHVPD